MMGVTSLGFAMALLVAGAAGEGAVDVFPDVRDFMRAHGAVPAGSGATPTSSSIGDMPQFSPYRGLRTHGLLSGGSGASYAKDPNCAYAKVPGFGPRTLLLLTHSNASLFDVGAGRVSRVLLHSKDARFRGAVPTAEGLWLLASPVTSGHDELWLLAAAAGGGGGGGSGVRVARKLPVPGTGDAHDAVCTGKTFWLVDTIHGHVHKIETPTPTTKSLRVVRSIEAWSRGEHINQIGVSARPQTAGHAIFVGVHGRGRPSRIDTVAMPMINTKKESLSGLGKGAHGLVLWRNAYIVHLDSAANALALLDLETGDYAHVWNAPAGTFLKGLAVVGDVAYFGASPESASLTDRLSVQVTLVAVDLAAAKNRTGATTVFQAPLEGFGLLNQVVAPSYVCAALEGAIDSPPPQAAGAPPPPPP